MKTINGCYGCILVIAITSWPAFALAAEAEKTYRFAEKPWGLDSPAGRCVVCHSLEKNGPHRVAPNLWGIVGAPKAAKSWYNYSSALRAKDGVWTEQELDQFLADANQFAPGSTKSIKVKDAAERKAIIDFLKTLQ
ncbi:MAG: c-type cytochrome [Gammaproteobacteria bacterium]|jgi:cytochrome c|nr:c-type cytochrome [Gammaproteobacteria bacterium]